MRGRIALLKALPPRRAGNRDTYCGRPPELPHGRGCGVGRSLGCGLGLGVGVGRVAVGVAVGVGVSVGVGGAVGVGVTVGVGLGGGVGVASDMKGAITATLIGEPVLKKPTFAVLPLGGALESNRKLYNVPKRIALAF